MIGWVRRWIDDYIRRIVREELEAQSPAVTDQIAASMRRSILQGRVGR